MHQSAILIAFSQEKKAAKAWVIYRIQGGICTIHMLYICTIEHTGASPNHVLQDVHVFSQHWAKFSITPTTGFLLENFVPVKEALNIGGKSHLDTTS
jgi:hypothetical protein